jgi:hypothetical protein
LISFLVIFFISLFQLYGDISFGNLQKYAEYGRINSTMNDPNSLSNYLIMLFPIFIGFGFYLINFKKMLGIASFILGALTLFLLPYTGARIGMLGIIIIFLFYAFYLRRVIIFKILPKRKNKKLILNLISYLVIFTILASIIFGFVFLIENIEMKGILPPGFQRIMHDINSVAVDDIYKAFISIMNDRDILWIQSINMFIDHPLKGVGIGQFIFKLPDYNLMLFNDPYIVIDNPTNLYLEILSEMGIFQLLLFIWFFAEVIISSIFIFRMTNSKKFRFLYMNFFLSFIVMVLIYCFTGVTSSFAVRYLFFTIIGILVSFRINFSEIEKTI